jgi:hypothetical protein
MPNTTSLVDRGSDSIAKAFTIDNSNTNLVTIAALGREAAQYTVTVVATQQAAALADGGSWTWMFTMLNLSNGVASIFPATPTQIFSGPNTGLTPTFTWSLSGMNLTLQVANNKGAVNYDWVVFVEKKRTSSA